MSELNQLNINTFMISSTAFMENEKPDPYSASFGQLGQSAMSFGLMQNDVGSQSVMPSTGLSAYTLLHKALIDNHVSAVEANRICNEMAVHGLLRSNVSLDDINLVNAALTHDASLVQAQDEATSQGLITSVRGAMQVASSLQHGAGVLDIANPDPTAVAIIAEWSNQSGGLGGFRSWLQSAPLTGPLTTDDIKNYLKTQTYFAKNPETVFTKEMGRISNAVKVGLAAVSASNSATGGGLWINPNLMDGIITPWSASGLIVPRVIIPSASVVFSREIDIVPWWIPASIGILYLALKDPLIIDLSGKGLNIVPEEISQVYYDETGDGIAHQTSWFGAGSGALISLAPSSNGSVESSLIESFDQLSQMTNVGSGIIDPENSAWNELGVWQDLNLDGKVDPGEIESLSQLGIVSLSMSKNSSTQAGDGYVVTETIQAQMLDGSTREIASVELTSSDMLTSISGDNTNSTSATFPDLHGFGSLPSLREAMSNDPALASLILSLTSSPTNDFVNFRDEVKAILIEWENSSLSPSNIQSSDNSPNTRILNFVNDLTGNTNLFGPTSSLVPTIKEQDNLLNESWNTIEDGLEASIIVQISGNVFSDNFHYDLSTGLIIPSIYLPTAIAAIAAAAPGNSSELVSFWIIALKVIYSSLNDVESFAPQDMVAIYRALDQYAPPYISRVLLPYVTSQLLYIGSGTNMGEEITGSGEANILISNMDGQILVGGGMQADNEFIVGPGPYKTEISDLDSADCNDVILITSNDTASTIQVYGGNDDSIYIGESNGGSIKITHALDAAQGLSKLEFVGGDDLSIHQLIELEMSVVTNQSGSMYGTPNADILDGQGIDTILGGNGGGDSFIFKQGYGQLEIIENDPGVASNTLDLGPGIGLSEITASSTPQGDLILNIADGSNDIIKLDKMLSDPEWGVSTVVLSDGPVLSRQTLVTLANTGSPGNTTITALLPGAQIDPAGYAHSVISNGGNSTITYNADYGALEINLRDPELSYANTLSFGPGILTTDVTTSADSSGNIILTIGSAGDVITLDAMALGPNNGVQRILFSNGTVWSAQQIVSQVSLNLADHYGSANFNRGEGNEQISGMGLAAVQLGTDIAPGDVYIQSDASGDLIIRLRDDTADSLIITNDIYQTSGPLGRISSRVHQIFYQDGTYIDLNAPLTFTWVGNSYTHVLVGVNYASNIFELGVGGDHITAGNASEGGSGDNTFLFGRGDGAATVTLNGGAGVISLAPGITQSDIALHSNAAGDLTVVILDTGDTLTIKADLFTSPWGGSSAVDHIQFSDGTKIQLALVNFQPQLVNYSWVGLGDGQTLIGSSWGTNSFIVGPNNTNIVAGSGGPNGALYGTNFNSFFCDEGDGN